MNRNNQKTLRQVISAYVIVFLYGCFINSSFAGEGDTYLEAISLSYNMEYSASISSEFTPDYYMVKVPAKGRLVVNVYDINLPNIYDDIHLSIFRVTQNSVGQEYIVYENLVAESKNDYITSEKIDIPGLERGIYFLKVWPEDFAIYEFQKADYKIKAEFSFLPPVVSDDIGDQKKYAIPIVNQLPTVCTLSDSNDIDYFECQLPDYANMTLELTNVTGSNVHYELYTASDILVSPTNTIQSFYYEELSPGQYFIKIFGDGSADYTLTATQWFSGASDVKDDVGNNLSHAMPLLTSNPSVFCLQPDDSDVDIFCIYQPKDGIVTVDVFNILNWHYNDDILVQILDEYGNTIVESDNSRGTTEHIDKYLPRGQYFVAVYSKAYDDGVVYTIQVETTVDDVGDAFNQAMQIHSTPYVEASYGYPYVGLIDKPGDVDIFQVILKDEGYIYLKLDRMLYSNIDMQLLDANYNLLQSGTKTGTQMDVIYLDNLEAGVYFIKVYSPDNLLGQYCLIPYTSTETSIIIDDIGDNMSRALPLIPYRRVNGYLWDDNTIDYFTFTLDSIQNWVRLKVNNQNVQGNSDLKLCVYNEFGIEIGKSENTTPMDEIVELADLGPGIYYARIDPTGSYQRYNNIQYSIILETDVAPLPSAGLSMHVDVNGTPGEIIYTTLILDNKLPEEITSMSAGVQFDPNILEPVGISNLGLTQNQLNAQVRYSRSENTMSVSMNTFSTIESGELLNLIFRIKPDAVSGESSILTLLSPTLNGAIVHGTDGLVTVINSVP